MIFCIPSYKRANVLKAKTLALLQRTGFPADAIHVYVADESEKAEYESVLTSSCNIHIGVLGLVPQRQHIIHSWPEGTEIVMMDDDVSDFMTVGTDGKLCSVPELPTILSGFFSAVREAGASIWGVYPVANAFFMKPRMTTDFKFILGTCYGIVNRHDADLEIPDRHNKEDTWRTVKYWQKDAIVCRFENYCIKTQFYAPGGILVMDPERKSRSKVEVEELVTAYPTLLRADYRKRGGVWEAKFRPQRSSKKAKEAAPSDYTVTAFDLRDCPELHTSRAVLLEKVRKVTIPKIDRTRIVKTGKNAGKVARQRSEIIGEIGRTCTFGYILTRAGYKQAYMNRKHPELLKALVEYGNRVVPVGFSYNAITLNVGVKAKKHIDGRNVGFSVLTGLGDYTGGKLRVYERNGEDFVAHETIHKGLMFNGALRAHETEPFEGNRITVIYYKHHPDGKINGFETVGI